MRAAARGQGGEQPGRGPHRGGERRGRASARPRSPCTPRTRSARSSPTASSTWTCSGPARSRPTPGEVLARFLRDLGVEGDKVPARDDERAALYRTTLTGRRVLILLDNAKDAAQVRPLLPGSSSCAVLVTTRNRTSGPGEHPVRRPERARGHRGARAVLHGSWARSGRRPSRTPPPRCSSPAPGCRWRSGSARRGWRRAGSGGSPRWRAGCATSTAGSTSSAIGDLAVRASFQVSYDSLRPAAARRRPGPGVPAAWPLAGRVDQPGGRGGAGRGAGRRRRGRARDAGRRQPARVARPGLVPLPRPAAGLRHRARAGGGDRGRAGRGGAQAAVVVPGHRGGRRGTRCHRTATRSAERARSRGSPAAGVRRRGRRAGLVRR